MPRRQRLDAELVRRGLARSRAQAGELVAAGRVMVAGRPAAKAATQVDLAESIRVQDDEGIPQYASRGGHKLAGALEVLAGRGLRVQGRRCLDAGASTGGFTDVLLRRGADCVVAVDVGYGQLVWRLQQHPRVRVLDRTNVRTLTPEQVAPAPDLVVGDLSFISLTLVLPALVACCARPADLLLMVKPQFEVGRERLGSGGVVRDPALHGQAVRTVASAGRKAGLEVLDVVASPLPGPSGNVEYFLWMQAPGAVTDPAGDDIDLAGDDINLDAVIARAVAEGPAGAYA